MAGFLIYIPGARGAAPEHLAKVGLADLAGDAAPACKDVLERGPDGGRGVVCWWDDPAHPDRTPRGGVFLDAQRWAPAKAFPEKSLAAGRFWLGCEKKEKPRPADLERRQLQPGADVRLADGQLWHVPIAWQLPQLLGLADDGRVASRPVAKYRGFWDAAWRAMDWFRPNSAGKCSIDFEPGYDFCCQALSINYRVNRDVADFLGLIDTDALFAIPKAVVELEMLVEAEKKTGPATPATAAGGAG